MHAHGPPYRRTLADPLGPVRPCLGYCRLTCFEASYEHALEVCTPSERHRRGVDDSDGRQRAAQADRGGGPAFDLVMSKLHRPPIRPGTVRRSSLIDRLAAMTALDRVGGRAGGLWEDDAAVAVGRAQWPGLRLGFGGRNRQRPKVLLTYVAEALDAVQPVGGRVFDALASPASSVPGSVVPRLGAAFSAMTAPVVLVLDDVHLLHNSECRAALSVLADHVPGGSRLAFAGRAEPPLRIARLRAEGKILEIGPGDLSLTRDEASSLLRAAEVVLGADDVAELHRRTEGWPVGLYLAALCLREGGSLPSAAISFGGDDRRQRLCGVGVPGADLPAATGVLDPDRGAGADVRAAV